LCEDQRVAHQDAGQARQSEQRDKAERLVEHQEGDDCGFSAIRIGARVLRTETAAVAGLAALQTLWGDF